MEFEEKEGGVLRAENFVVDPGSHTATAGERVVANLTRKEFDLLYELVRRRLVDLAGQKVKAHRLAVIR